jgi:hypothetical protein
MILKICKKITEEKTEQVIRQNELQYREEDIIYGEKQKELTYFVQ